MSPDISIIKKHWYAVCLLLILAVIASSPLLGYGWFKAQDYEAHLTRLLNVSYEMRNGDFYPRWLSMASLGHGSPVLNFYAPATYLVMGCLQILGFPVITALKLFSFVMFILGSWGMFIWTRKYYCEAGALLAATIYMFVPYHFLDMYVRGAIPEFAALALLPFLFHAIDLSLSSDRQMRGIIFAAATSAAIVLTHNLSALLIAPFALVYFIWCSFSLHASAQRFMKACSGPLLGAGLSAFYWLPVVAEAKYLRGLQSIVEGVYTGHFVYPSQLFSSLWGFGGSTHGPNDEMSFQIGYVLLGCVLAGSAAIIVTRDAHRGLGGISLVLGLSGLFMTVSLSSQVYEFFPILENVQFPWRFLGPATLFLAAFSGIIVNNRLARWKQWTLLIAVVFLCIFFSDNQRVVKERITEDFKNGIFTKIDNKPVGEYWSEHDFIPKGEITGLEEVPNSPMLITINNEQRFLDCNVRGSRITCHVAAESGSFIVLPWFNFPGWKAEIDNSGVSVYSTRQGFIMFPVPQGEHAVQVWFGTTWPRITGWLIAVITLVIIGCLSAAGIHFRPWQRRQ